MKKEAMLFGVLFLALLLPLASAGLLDKLFSGKDVKKSPQDFSVTVGNAAPTVAVQAVTDPIIGAGSTAPVNIIFRATDNNGVATLVDNSIIITVNYPGGGEETKIGTLLQCDIPSNIDSLTREYNCNVNMSYYDHEGTWNINVSIQDANEAEAYDDDNTFSVPVLKAITFPLGTVGFGSVTPGQTNQPSLSPTTLTNNGNYELDGTTNLIYINSTPLIGIINPAYFIPAQNFKAAGSSQANVCTTGTDLTGTSVTIPTVILSKGSPVTPFPTENISYCLTLVPAGLIDQAYSTTATGGLAWEITY